MKITNRIRLWLFKILPFETYLWLLSQLFFVSYSMGFLKNKALYRYNYLLADVIKKDDVVLDIGANLGYFTKLFSKWVGPNGFVHAIEPIKDMVTVLRRNSKRLKNVKVYPYALGAEEKEIQLGNLMRRGYVNSGSHFVMDSNIQVDKEVKHTSPALMKQGSKLFGDLPKISFIKIDTEGYEKVILPEMETLIETHKPKVLAEAWREDRELLNTFFTELGYKGIEYDEDKLVYFGQRKSKAYGDILFVHSSDFETLPNLILNQLSS